MAVRHKKFNLGSIASSGASLQNELRIEVSRAEFITAIALHTDQPAQLVNRGEIGLLLNSEELLPDGWPARELLIGGQNVRPNDRMFTKFGRLAYGSGTLRYTYRDVNSAALTFSPYTVYLLLEYEYND